MLDEAIITRVIDRIESGNTFILKKIGETIKEIGELTPSQAHSLQQMIKYGSRYDTIVQRLSQITNINVKEIDEIMEAYAKKDYQFAKKFYDYRGIDYIPYEKFTALKNEVDAISRLTNQTYMNMVKTNTIGFTLEYAKGKFRFFSLQDSYNYAIDQALLSITQGKDTFQNQMYSLLKQFGDGVKTIDYKSGRTRRLDSAVRMLLRDGVRQLHNASQEVLGESFAADMIEISVHSHPALDHLMQGHQFLISEFKKLQNGEEAKDLKGKTYTLDHNNDGNFRPISTMNCYHNVFYGVAGVNEPQYTDKQLQEIIDKNNEGFNFENKHYTMYDGEQLLRNIELNLRKNKDMQILGRNANNKMIIDEAQYKITQLTNKYKQVLKTSGLKSKLERARVVGYKRINTSNLK